MSGKRNLVILIAIGLSLMLGAAVIYASVWKPRPRSRVSQNANRAEPSNSPASVRRVAIWQQLRPALSQFGDRLEKAGKERLIINGLLKEAGNSSSYPIQLVTELPNQVRLTIQDGISQRVLIFDGAVARVRGHQLDNEQLDLIESLVYDTAEHFFISESDGIATRSLGSHFRMDDGSFTDMYQIEDRIKLGNTARSETKYYCFNSDTHLLDSVHYQLMRNGLPIKVETSIDKWRKENGTALAGRITRTENGVTVFSLTVTSISVSPRTNDGIFVTP